VTTAITRTVKVSSDEVESNTKRGGDLRVTLSPKTVGCTSGFGGVMTLEPGDWVTEHYHPYSEEFLTLVEGELTVDLDGVATPLSAGEALFIPKYTRHRLRNTGSGPVRAVFHLGPLAPRPELGHVDTEASENS
jgi:putative monooxygenase